MHSANWKFGTQFEYTGRATPQRNHLAELAFFIIANRGRAMLSAANVPKNMRHTLWKEAFKTATLLDGLAVIKLDGVYKTRYEHWGVEVPKFSNYLHKWGEAGIVKVRTSTTPKIFDCGTLCMLVGYAESHAGDTFCIWNPSLTRVHVSRDVKWLKRMFFEVQKSDDLRLIPIR